MSDRTCDVPSCKEQSWIKRDVYRLCQRHAKEDYDRLARASHSLTGKQVAWMINYSAALDGEDNRE